MLMDTFIGEDRALGEWNTNMSVIQLVADVYREDRFIHSRLRVGILIMEITGQKAVYV